MLAVPIVADRTVEYPAPDPAEHGHVRAPGLDYYDRYWNHFSTVLVRTSRDFRPSINCGSMRIAPGFPVLSVRTDRAWKANDTWTRCRSAISSGAAARAQSQASLWSESANIRRRCRTVVPRRSGPVARRRTGPAVSVRSSASGLCSPATASSTAGVIQGGRVGRTAGARPLPRRRAAAKVNASSTVSPGTSGETSISPDLLMCNTVRPDKGGTSAERFGD